MVALFGSPPAWGWIVLLGLVVLLMALLAASVVRRRRQDHLIARTLGERHRPDRSHAIPAEQEAIDGTKRADELGRSRRQWS
jgi:LPXTG-motif cell wall-anchored protein